MANYNSSITYGGLTINALRVTPVKQPESIKQKLGSGVVQINVIGRTKQDYYLDIQGIVYANTYTLLGTSRGSLEALDDGEPHALVDGIHDGNYIIETGSLRFNDSGDDGNSMFRYTMKLVQKQ
jgi:hypothetical protein